MANINIRVEDDGGASAQFEISSLEELNNVLAAMPEGSTADILSSDLEVGNFEVAHLVTAAGSPVEIRYSGPVAEGEDNDL